MPGVACCVGLYMVLTVCMTVLLSMPGVACCVELYMVLTVCMTVLLSMPDVACCVGLYMVLTVCMTVLLSMSIRTEEKKNETGQQNKANRLPAGRLRGPPRRGLFLSGVGERCGDFGNPPKGLHKKGKTSNNTAIHDGYLYEFPTGKENL